jgi:hypothetical protein
VVLMDDQKNQEEQNLDLTEEEKILDHMKEKKTSSMSRRTKVISKMTMFVSPGDTPLEISKVFSQGTCNTCKYSIVHV